MNEIEMAKHNLSKASSRKLDAAERARNALELVAKGPTKEESREIEASRLESIAARREMDLCTRAMLKVLGKNDEKGTRPLET